MTTIDLTVSDTDLEEAGKSGEGGVSMMTNADFVAAVFPSVPRVHSLAKLAEATTTNLEIHDSLPVKMRDAKRWLVWKSIPNPDANKKARKVPYYVNGTTRNGPMDTPADIAQFGTFDDAVQALRGGNYAGLGFALGTDGTGNHWQGIDLDHLSQHPELENIRVHLSRNTYTEKSPNGDGLHAIGYGRKFDALSSNATGIEAYSSGRFFTVTGDVQSFLKEPIDLADYVQETLKPIRSPKGTIQNSAIETAIDFSTGEILTQQEMTLLDSALMSLNADDRVQWVAVGHALKTLGEVGRELWMAWSKTSRLHDPVADSKTWDSFNPTRTDWKIIFAKAHIAGWKPPASGVLQTNLTTFSAPLLIGVDSRDGTADTRPLTELGNAQRMFDVHGDRLRYVHDAGQWILWRDGAWHWCMGGADVRSLAAELPGIIYGEGMRHSHDTKYFAAWSRLSQKKQTIANAVALLSDFGEVRLLLLSLDAGQFVVGLDRARQVIDLSTGAVRAAVQSDYLTKSLCVSTVGDPAKAVRWLAFLQQVFEGDVELIDWLHRWCGYMLTGSTKEHVYIFAFGIGANGKGVFGELLKYLLGDYARLIAPETLMESRRQAGGATPDLAVLIGARLALSSETEDGSALAEALIKSLVAGDSMSVRPLYGAPIEFKPCFKLLILGNHKPRIRGVDLGIWRRVRLVPFNRIFLPEERDPQLLDKLKLEAPHILAWMVQGCMEWQRRRLTDVPGAVSGATEDYRQDQDSIGTWLEERCLSASHLETTTADLYADYRRWALAGGLHPVSAARLGRSLSERGYSQRKSHGQRLWKGIALRGVTLEGVTLKDSPPPWIYRG